MHMLNEHCSCSHLATKARLLSEAKGKVQHIQLFVCGFILDLCKIFLKELKLTHLMTPHRMQKTYRCENHVTRGAGQGAFTCTKPIQVDVIVDGNVQQVVTILCLVLNKCFHSSSILLVTWTVCFSPDSPIS